VAKSEAFTFKVRIGREWVMYVVDVPARIGKAMGAAGAVPVVFTLNGSSPRRTTMAKRAAGGHRLHIHGEVRRETGVGEGDTVTIALRRDTEPRGVEPPPDLADALREVDALDAFRAFGPAEQRELVAWMDDAKRDETRVKRIARIVERACAKREKLLDRGR